MKINILSKTSLRYKSSPPTTQPHGSKQLLFQIQSYSSSLYCGYSPPLYWEDIPRYITTPSYITNISNLACPLYTNPSNHNLLLSQDCCDYCNEVELYYNPCFTSYLPTGSPLNNRLVTNSHKLKPTPPNTIINRYDKPHTPSPITTIYSQNCTGRTVAENTQTRKPALRPGYQTCTPAWQTLPSDVNCNNRYTYFTKQLPDPTKASPLPHPYKFNISENLFIFQVSPDNLTDPGKNRTTGVNRTVVEDIQTREPEPRPRYQNCIPPRRTLPPDNNCNSRYIYFIEQPPTSTKTTPLPHPYEPNIPKNPVIFQDKLTDPVATRTTGGNQTSNYLERRDPQTGDPNLLTLLTCIVYTFLTKEPNLHPTKPYTATYSMTTKSDHPNKHKPTISNLPVGIDPKYMFTNNTVYLTYNKHAYFFEIQIQQNIFSYSNFRSMMDDRKRAAEQNPEDPIKTPLKPTIQKTVVQALMESGTAPAAKGDRVLSISPPKPPIVPQPAPPTQPPVKLYISDYWKRRVQTSSWAEEVEISDTPPQAPPFQEKFHINDETMILILEATQHNKNPTIKTIMDTITVFMTEKGKRR